MNAADLWIRPVADTDDLAALTALLHRAYAPLAAAGMRFYASHQTEEATRRRLERGLGFVTLLGDRLAGTITLHPQAGINECAWYQCPDVWYFGQYAVDPDLQGLGIGRALLDFAEQTARDGDAAELALDTSESAAGLIAFYKRQGYRQAGTVQWPLTNYLSLVLSKTL